jgi:hypothetical protein
MNILQRDKSRSRGRKAHLEYLDARIVPAVVHPTLAVAADVAIASAHSQQHGENAVAGKFALEIRHEQRIAKFAERRDARLERREAALDRRAALDAARHNLTAATTAQGASGSSASSSGAGSSAGPTTNASPISPATPSSPSVPVNPLPANVSTLFDTVYQEYQNGDLPSGPGKPGQVEIQGSSVGVQIQTSNSSDFSTLVADAESLGLQVTDASAAYNIVVGFLPIAALPSVAQLPGSPSITPLLYPLMN